MRRDIARWDRSRRGVVVSPVTLARLPPRDARHRTPHAPTAIPPRRPWRSRAAPLS